jgi:hypothetical protein
MGETRSSAVVEPGDDGPTAPGLLLRVKDYADHSRPAVCTRHWAALGLYHLYGARPSLQLPAQIRGLPASG